MERELTSAQKRVFEAISTFIDENHYPPSTRDIADALGLTPSTVHEQLRRLERKGYIKRNKNRARSIEIIEEYSDAPLSGESVEIPILGEISAGSPILSEENHMGYIEVDTSITTNGNFFALRVNGCSMKDCGIYDGGYVVVKQQPVANSGDIVVALLGGEATVKRLKIESEGIFLNPENPEFNPIDVTLREDLRILGKVISFVKS